MKRVLIFIINGLLKKRLFLFERSPPSQVLFGESGFGEPFRHFTFTLLYWKVSVNRFKDSKVVIAALLWNTVLKTSLL
jgi:hypothetical protein